MSRRLSISKTLQSWSKSKEQTPSSQDEGKVSVTSTGTSQKNSETRKKKQELELKHVSDSIYLLFFSHMQAQGSDQMQGLTAEM